MVDDHNYIRDADNLSSLDSSVLHNRLARLYTYGGSTRHVSSLPPAIKKPQRHLLPALSVAH